MARANRHYLPGHVWHITHRCHKREFLLKFSKDKKRWVSWLFEAKKRYGLSILNYTVTSNHIHLLVFDNEKDVIPQSIQLLAGRTAREFNQRKKRKGAFWEDRYHATAVQTGDHLIRCLVYIDLNMVRTGKIQHPSTWEYGGYNEIQSPRQRYSLIDRPRLLKLLEIKDEDELKSTHATWVEKTLQNRTNCRNPIWTESIAVGDEEFILSTKDKLGGKAIGRQPIASDPGFELKEYSASYKPLFTAKKKALSFENSYNWDSSLFNTIC